MSYGNSENPDSPHFDDQMEMFSKFETKKMSFDKNFILYKEKQNPKLENDLKKGNFFNP